MEQPPVDDDGALTRWLAGDRLAVLDAVLGQAVDIVGIVDRDLKIRYLNYAAPGLSREAGRAHQKWIDFDQLACDGDMSFRA